jgi:DNA-binding NarL/FixJ family response regulator
LAAGLGASEIAERLYLPPKAVGHHVGHIPAMVGVHARSEMAAAHLGLHLTAPEK